MCFSAAAYTKLASRRNAEFILLLSSRDHIFINKPNCIILNYNAVGLVFFLGGFTEYKGPTRIDEFIYHYWWEGRQA